MRRSFNDDAVDYGFVNVAIDRAKRSATITLHGPDQAPPASVDAMTALGAAFWPLQVARELDDAILHLRINEFEIGTLVFKSAGDVDRVLAYDAFLADNAAHWLVGEIRGTLEERTQARRRDLAQPRDLDRARLLLRRHARRNRIGLRPFLHVDWPARGRRTAARDRSR